jgi:hypothetical protein
MGVMIPRVLLIVGDVAIVLGAFLLALWAFG